MEALVIAEEKHQRPVFYLEIYHALYENAVMPIGPLIIFRYCMVELIIHDDLLVNTETNRFSLDMKLQNRDDNPTDYEFFSDRFTRKYPDYIAVGD